MKKERESQKKPSSGIDWSEIRARVEAAGAAIQRGMEKTAEQKKEILERRAEELAREPEAEEMARSRLEVVEFLLAYETYAIGSAHVREVYPLTHLTPVPCAPPFVLGMTSVRGQILSIVDLKKFFELPEETLTELNKIIIVRDESVEFGILADDVLGVRSIPLDELEPSLPTLTGIRAAYLKGVTPERVVVLDVDKILSDERIVVHEEVKD